MADSRFGDLSLLCIKKDFLKTIPSKSFIEQFISKPPKINASLICVT